MKSSGRSAVARQRLCQSKHRGADLGAAVLQSRSNAPSQGPGPVVSGWTRSQGAWLNEGTQLVGLPQPGRVGGGRVHLRQLPLTSAAWPDVGFALAFAMLWGFDGAR